MKNELVESCGLPPVRQNHEPQVLRLRCAPLRMTEKMGHGALWVYQHPIPYSLLPIPSFYASTRTGLPFFALSSSSAETIGTWASSQAERSLISRETSAV